MRTLATLTDNVRLFPGSASNFSRRVDALLLFLTVTSVLMTLLLGSLVLSFAIRYRRREENEVPPETRQPKWLEVSVALCLSAVFLFIFAWGAVLYIDMKRPAAAPQLELNVVAKQWMWKIYHPAGQREINELHVPVNTVVKLNMTSQDVIHSFGLPDFRIKQDVLPTTSTSQWFTATRTGESHLFCQEYCGTDHSAMIGKVVVLSGPDYAAWLAGTPAGDTQVAAGQKLFTSLGCIQCHGQSAPTLAQLYNHPRKLSDGTTITADDAYLRESILTPAAKLAQDYAPQMPSYKGRLSEEQLNTLIAYIKSLEFTPAPRTPPAQEGVPK